MTMAVRFSMISTYPGQGALMDGPDPAWRLPMSAFHWTRLDGLADSGVTTGDSTPRIRSTLIAALSWVWGIAPLRGAL